MSVCSKTLVELLLRGIALIHMEDDVTCPKSPSNGFVNQCNISGCRIQMLV